MLDRIHIVLPLVVNLGSIYGPRQGRTTKAVPSRAEGSDPLLLERLDDFVEGGSGLGLCVVNEPFLDVEGFLLVAMVSVRRECRRGYGRGRTPGPIASAGMASPFK